jgi:hypothetical protein
MSQRKGVRLPTFGTFTFDLKGEPCFIMANDLSTQFKLKQRACPTADQKIPTTAINFTQVQDSITGAGHNKGAASSGLSRELIEKVYSKYLTVLGRSLFEGRTVLVTFHKVAEVTLGNGELSYSLIPDFYKIFVTHPTPKKGADVGTFSLISLFYLMKWL